jgi:transposase
MTKVALGLDVAKATIEVRLLRSGEKRGSMFSIDNSIAGGQKLLSWLQGTKFEDIHVCLEPTGKYSRVIAGFLHESGLKVSQVNSYAVLHHGRSKNFRSKTDRIDAYLLADYCLKENPAAWQPPAGSQTELADLQTRMDQIDENLRQEQNRLEAGASRIAEEDIREHIAQLIVRKESLTRAAKAVVMHDGLMRANFEIVKSIIGIGEKSALALLSAVRFDQFKNPRNVGCFAGLTPARHESGTSISGKGCISRQGSSQLRKRLYFPAMVAMQFNPQMRVFAERLRSKGKPPKLIIAAVMRKLLVLAAILIRKQEFYDPTKNLSIS